MSAKIAYFTTSGDPGRTLLLVHGDFSSGRGAWRRQVEALGSKCRLIVVDRRGHGESPAGDASYTIAQDAEDLWEVLHAEGAYPAHVAGHSYGALVALELACAHPGAIASLHLIEPPYLSLAPGHPDVASLAQATRALKASNLTDEELAEAFFRLVLGDEAAQALKSKPAWERLVPDADRFRREEFAGDYPAGALRRLPPGTGVSLYSGGQSHPGLQEATRRLASLIPGARYHFFPGAGHDVQRLGEPFEAALLAAVCGA